VTTSGNLPHLEILPVDQLILHEHYDYQRTPPIIRSIKDSGILRNPPVVMPLMDGSERYMVLDGANRTTALRDMQIPHILAQIVQADDPGIDLNPWNHVVWGAHVDTFLDWMRSVPDLTLLPSKQEHLFRDLLDIHSLALMQLADGRVYTVYTQFLDLRKRIAVLNDLVLSYAKRTKMDRTSSYQIDGLQSLYLDLSGLVLLPPVQIDDLLLLAGEGILMPTGSTRFSISGRALYVNFPLGILSSTVSLEEKNQQLEEWIQESIASKRVRYYAEPVYMFDE
jgi:hypothetical protein